MRKSKADIKKELSKHKAAALSPKEMEHLQYVASVGSMQKIASPEITDKLIEHGYLVHRIGGIAITPKGQMMAYVGRAE